MLENDGVGFAGYAAGGMGQVPKAPDLIAIPDPSSFTPIPFVQPGLAIVHCDPHVDEEPWPYATRLILKETLRRPADLGHSVDVGAKVDNFIINHTHSETLSTHTQSQPNAQP